MLKNLIDSLEFQESWFVPNDFQKDLALLKNLLDENCGLSKKYFLLQSLYQYYFELYLDEILNIQFYDQLFFKSSLDYQEVSIEEQDIYQLRSQFHYYYVRNTLYIEKLTLEDLNFLEKCYDCKENGLTDELRVFIQRTYPFVLFGDNDSKDVFTNYGPLSSTFFAPKSALVIGFRYDAYQESKGKDWEDNFILQNEFLYTTIEKQLKNYEQKLDIPITILVYDEQSVKKIEN